MTSTYYAGGLKKFVTEQPREKRNLEPLPYEYREALRQARINLKGELEHQENISRGLLLLIVIIVVVTIAFMIANGRTI